MNTVPEYINDSAHVPNTNYLKKLPWSLAFAMIPFIPDILETVKSIPDQIAKNGYALYVKHGQTEVHYNRADNVSGALRGGPNNDENE